MVKIYTFFLKDSISTIDRNFLLSKLDASEVLLLPNQRSKNYDLSILSKVLLKKIVSEQLNVSEREIITSKTDLGKPFVKFPRGVDIDISVSHSGHYLAIAVCSYGKIGVDIELIKDFDLNNIQNVFSEDELAYINAAQELDRRLMNFYEIWTRKEAYLKAIGKGFSNPLPKIPIDSQLKKLKDKIKYGKTTFNLSTMEMNEFIMSVCDDNFIPATITHTEIDSVQAQLH